MEKSEGNEEKIIEVTPETKTEHEIKKRVSPNPVKINPEAKKAQTKREAENIRFNFDIILHRIGNLFETKKESEKARAIERIGELLKEGVDRVVIHGAEIKMPDGSKEMKSQPDIDTLGALYLLNNTFKKTESGEEPIVTYNEGAFSEIVPKGKGYQEPARPGEVILHIDTGGEELEVESPAYAEGVTKIFIDHHGEQKREPTSATALMYEVLTKNKTLKEKPAWLENFVKFVNDVDNLSYLEKKDAKGNKIFTEQYFRESWPKSLYGLYKNMPLKEIVTLLESGRDPATPFSDEALNGSFGKMVVGHNEKGEGISLAEIVEERKNKASETISGLKNAFESMKSSGIREENEELGKVILHDFAAIRNKENPKIREANTVPNELGFIGAKALGYDTYAVWNPKNKNFFINSSTKDLEPIYEKLAKEAPGTQSIRGVMIYPPKDEKNLFYLNKEKFLDILGLKKAEDKNLKIMKLKEEKKLAEKRGQKHKAVYLKEQIAESLKFKPESLRRRKRIEK